MVYPAEHMTDESSVSLLVQRNRIGPPFETMSWTHKALSHPQNEPGLPGHHGTTARSWDPLLLRGSKSEPPCGSHDVAKPCECFERAVEH